ncbi:MAG: type I restriction enzyme HsdR N-terminal domain-containing protein [Nitrospinae bacterium]|nr:type I restriction enzyme HsdR N-terminal domain-containing protein [Nitrospinota bacterium]
MAAIPAKVVDRISDGLKRLQPIMSSAKSRDVNESDTVTIIVDLLSDVFGYDRYAEITREFVIRNTFCDLAVKIDGKPCLLIEVKAIGLELKDSHVKQAVDYAANEGIEWVALTNGNIWCVYRVAFEKPISHELVFEVDLLTLNPRKRNEIESLYVLSREGIRKSALDEYHIQRQAMSRYMLGALLRSEPVLMIVRRELKRLAPDARVSLDDIEHVLINDVFKRDVVDGDRALEAKKKVDRMIKRLEKAKTLEKRASADESNSSVSPDLDERADRAEISNGDV